MKIAVASEGENEDSLVSLITGRAPFYLIFEDRKLVKTIKNPFKIGGGGAGIGVAQMLANEGVDMVISGRFGPNVQAWLDSKNIKMYSVEEKASVREVVEEAIKNAKTSEA